DVTPEDRLSIKDCGQRIARQVEQHALGIGPEFVRQSHLREKQHQCKHVGRAGKTQDEALALGRSAADLDAALGDDNHLAALRPLRAYVGAARVKLGAGDCAELDKPRLGPVAEKRAKTKRLYSLLLAPTALRSVGLEPRAHIHSPSLAVLGGAR